MMLGALEKAWKRAICSKGDAAAAFSKQQSG